MVAHDEPERAGQPPRKGNDGGIMPAPPRTTSWRAGGVAIAFVMVMITSTTIMKKSITVRELGSSSLV